MDWKFVITTLHSPVPTRQNKGLELVKSLHLSVRHTKRPQRIDWATGLYQGFHDNLITTAYATALKLTRELVHKIYQIIYINVVVLLGSKIVLISTSVGIFKTFVCSNFYIVEKINMSFGSPLLVPNGTYWYNLWWHFGDDNDATNSADSLFFVYIYYI